jgi:hypothetical protein
MASRGHQQLEEGVMTNVVMMEWIYLCDAGNEQYMTALPDAVTALGAARTARHRKCPVHVQRKVQRHWRMTWRIASGLNGKA